MLENGYEVVGWMSFNGKGNALSNEQLIEQARAVGASVVIEWHRYRNTVSGAIPFTTTSPSQIVTSNTNGTVNVNGNGGYATGNYSGTTTTVLPGTPTTQYIPYNIQRYDYNASFWAKRKRYGLGAYYVDLTAEQRVRLERNGGVTVVAIVKGTPAFSGNILAGDVIVKINGQDVVDTAGATAMLGKLAGQVVTFDLRRGGEARIVEIRLND
jgi:hypothetical protein